MGVEGRVAAAFCDALLGYGAEAAWVEEAVPEGGEEEPIFDDPVQGQGKHFLGNRNNLWVRAIWQNCRVVALFQESAEQVSRVSAS